MIILLEFYSLSFFFFLLEEMQVQLNRGSVIISPLAFALTTQFIQF